MSEAPRRWRAGRGASRACGAGALWLACGALASGCRREPPPGRPGEVIPLVPAARGDAGVADGASRADAQVATEASRRLERVELEPLARYRDMPGLARALEARAAALGADEIHSAVLDDARVALTFALGQPALRTLVLDQLPRRGVLELYHQGDGCAVWQDPLPAGLELGVASSGPYLRARPDPSRGVAPLAPLRAFLDAHPPPRGLRWLVGPVRDPGGDVARRSYCVLDRGALRAPRVASVVSRLDRITLEPVLEVSLAPPDDERLLRFTLDARGGTIVIAFDGEVMVSGVATAPIRTGDFRVVPQARVPGLSPEIVGALLRAGPLPTELRYVAR